jgi:hypothetical protein
VRHTRHKLSEIGAFGKARDCHGLDALVGAETATAIRAGLEKLPADRCEAFLALVKLHPERLSLRAISRRDGKSHEAVRKQAIAARVQLTYQLEVFR